MTSSPSPRPPTPRGRRRSPTPSKTPPALTDTAAVAITVTAVNDAPVAINDSYTISEDGTFTVGAPGVLANDTDVDERHPDRGRWSPTPPTAPWPWPPTARSPTPPTRTSPAPTPSPTPPTTASSTSNIATVTITVTAPINDAPIADDDALHHRRGHRAHHRRARRAGQRHRPRRRHPDRRPWSTDAAHGTVTLTADGAFTYTPDAELHRHRHLHLHRHRRHRRPPTPPPSPSPSPPINDAPVAVDDDRYTTAEDTALTIAAPGVLANDTDPDGDTLTVTAGRPTPPTAP